jgi:hypothetical protein
VVFASRFKLTHYRIVGMFCAAFSRNMATGKEEDEWIDFFVMATVFKHGALALTRKDAVATLRSFGFGKSMADEALSPDGRFSTYLQFAPNGMITWKGRLKIQMNAVG